MSGECTPLEFALVLALNDDDKQQQRHISVITVIKYRIKINKTKVEGG